jgi:citrate lyase subunit beta/citryl-CoA lyase
MKWNRDEAELTPARSAIVVASRAAGIEAPFDTVWTDLTDPEGFRASCRRAADLGFQGKMCIHPDQVAGANEAFAPSAEEVGRAERVVAAFKRAEAEGLASITVDGRFVDYPIVYRAQRLLARARLAAR